LSSPDPAPTDTVTLSLHDALPIFGRAGDGGEILRRARHPLDIRGDRSDHGRHGCPELGDHALDRSCTLLMRGLLGALALGKTTADRKSTRLNSSHVAISYAVFCLK